MKATARFSVVVVFATPPFWFANEMIFARRSDSSPMWAPGGLLVPGARAGASASWALMRPSSPGSGGAGLTGGADGRFAGSGLGRLGLAPAR